LNSYEKNLLMQYLCNEIQKKVVFDNWLDTFDVIRYATVDFSVE